MFQVLLIYKRSLSYLHVLSYWGSKANYVYLGKHIEIQVSKSKIVWSSSLLFRDMITRDHSILTSINSQQDVSNENCP